jgi:FkbM family methyltransferase
MVVSKDRTVQNLFDFDSLFLMFLTPNRLTKKRSDRLLTKEPDTIAWIDSMKGVLYDIGANVGTYSIYAGLKGITVYAFEPEAGNYDLLNQNIRHNGLKNVFAFCLSCTDKFSFDFLNLSTTEVGGSLHAFGATKDYRLLDFSPVYRQGSVGVPLDSIQLPKPDHIKIDVDGFEHLVVKGGEETIKQAQSVLVEINSHLPEHRELVKWMSQFFTYDEKQVQTARRSGGAMEGIGNYIFRK